ncbi:MAG: hypothetical protein R3Y54_08975 [Eubacteriales bacterium]
MTMVRTVRFLCECLEQAYGECFGFTEEEVEEMLVHYDREEWMSKVREWCKGRVG